MTTEDKFLVDYLDPDERNLLKKVQARAERNYAIVPALYRDNKLDAHKTTLIKQIKSDQYTISVLQRKAAIRRAREESLSRKINNQQYEELKRRFLPEETTS